MAQAPAVEEHHPGRSVAAARALKGQTQSDLAEQLARETGKEWSRVMVARLENGDKRFTLDTLRALIRIQGMDADFYLYGPGSDMPRSLKWLVSGGADPLVDDPTLFEDLVA